MHGVVPFAVEGIAADVEAVHLSIGYDDPLGIVGAVQFAADGQPRDGWVNSDRSLTAIIHGSEVGPV